MGVTAADVAAVLRQRLPSLPAKKLHKLLYYCQGHHLATFDKPLFPEAVSAFDMGPVVGSLWRREKDGVENSTTASLNEAELNTVGYVISRYGALSGRDLEILTHHENPWLRADEDRKPGGRVRIEREWMRDYFRSEDGEGEAIKPPTELLHRWRGIVAADTNRAVRADSIDDLRERLKPRG